MKVGRVALLLAAAAVLEFFVGRSPYRRFLPVDWFLLATAIVARSGDFVRAVLTGATAGVIEDALSQPLIGMNACAKAILGYALTIVSVRVVFGGSLGIFHSGQFGKGFADAVVRWLETRLPRTEPFGNGKTILGMRYLPASPPR